MLLTFRANGCDIGPVLKPKKASQNFDIHPHDIDNIKSASDIKKLAAKLNVDTSGGKQQVKRRLLELPESEISQISKQFLSLCGKTGGLLLALCPHGVVYAAKFLTLHEAYSDYTETFMSFKVKPTFSISDIAHPFSRHTNLNFPMTFRPFDGMICDPSDKKLVNDIKEGRKIDISVRPLGCEFDLDSYDDNSVHPMSGLAERFSLIDRLHEHNYNVDNRVLRKMDNVGFLEGRINTQVAEQINSRLKKQAHYLAEMKFGTHINTILYKLMLDNQHINNLFRDHLKKIKKGVAVKLNSNGCLVAENSDVIKRKLLCT